MKKETITQIILIADEGKVFDWAEPHYIEIDGEQVQEHLYVTTLFIGASDSIENYIEVEVA